MSTDMVRGYRAKMELCDDRFNIDTETLNEVLKPFINKRVATGCPLCDKIWNAGPEFVEHRKESDVDLVWANDGSVYLLFENLGDNLSACMQINYCPKCGRKLVEE